MTNEISKRVRVTYWRTPIVLWYKWVSGKRSPSVMDRVLPKVLRVHVGIVSSMPIL